MVRYPNSFTQKCSQYLQDIESRKTGGAPARDIHKAKTEMGLKHYSAPESGFKINLFHQHYFKGQ